MPDLAQSPTLSDLQKFVADLEKERGFEDQSVIDKCLLMGEEVGELFKAIRTREGLKVDIPGGDVGLELADILIYVCAIANRCEVDLEASFREKELINRRRIWVTQKSDESTSR